MAVCVLRKVDELLHQAITEAYPELSVTNGMVQPSKFGDYSCNAPLTIAQVICNVPVVGL